MNTITNTQHIRRSLYHLCSTIHADRRTVISRRQADRDDRDRRGPKEVSASPLHRGNLLLSFGSRYLLLFPGEQGAG
jgi:hypothetical protein